MSGIGICAGWHRRATEGSRPLRNKGPPIFKWSDVKQAVNLYPNVDIVDTLGP